MIGNSNNVIQRSASNVEALVVCLGDGQIDLRAVGYSQVHTGFGGYAGHIIE